MSSTFLKSDFASTPPVLPPRGKGLSGGRFRNRTGPLEWLGQRVTDLRARKAPALQLEFPDRFVRFRGLREFEFALASRTEFPASRIRDLMAMTPGALERAAGKVRNAERRFADILSQSVQEPALVGEYFRELELKLFSQDHNWREIMDGLVRLSPAYDAYKRIALIKYMQYLRARQNVMRTVFVEKTRNDQGAKLHATRALDGGAAPGFGDTSLFDIAAEDTDRIADQGFTCLPKGENIRVDLRNVREMQLLLAGNRMRLYTGRECYMVDEADNTYPLLPGKNLVGRHSGCDVVVDSACRAVSRHHLIVESGDDGSVLLTDLSSHGTEIPTALMPKP